MTTKKILLKAQKAKKDEYYTLCEDIAAEVSLYKSQLKGKKILCPCDWDESFKEQLIYKEEGYVASSNLSDPGGTIKEINIKSSKKKIEKKTSVIKCNFIKYLVTNAEAYGIKTITASGYDPSTGKGIKFQDINYSKYDLIITNPPFSEFREFIATMFENKKKFLVIGPLLALSYKEIFNKVKEDKLWLGYAKQLSGFRRDDGSELLSKNPEGSVPRSCKWYTNLDVNYRNDKITLTESVKDKKYEKYYNYKAINIKKTREIPYDYSGEMGVPISFISKYNPKQFKIIGKGTVVKKTKRWKGDKASLWTEKNNKPHEIPFERILIKNKKVKKG